MVALLCQCIPILDSQQLAPLCHERLRISLALERHIRCCRCHVSSCLHPLGKSHGRLGSSRRLSPHDRLLHSGLDSYGSQPEPSHLLRRICKNLPVSRPLELLNLGHQVFYTIGFGGMTYCVDVITADASKLKNRGLAYAFTSSPYIITAFAGASASENFNVNLSWRWGFGIFAIIFPIVAAPLFFVLKANLRKAEKQGIFVKSKSGRTLLQNIWYYCIEFDGKQPIEKKTQMSPNTDSE